MMLPQQDDEPISREGGFALLDAGFSGDVRRAVLAVSGGADSTALLALAGESRQRFADSGKAFLVATVDHGLRAGSAREAGEVARLAARYGLPHRTLLWRSAQRRGNLSAAARTARYALLADAARDWGAGTIMVAHHEDDQIETYLMAEERGEGPRRLAGMRLRRDLAPGLRVLRPLLHLRKRRLVASLRSRGLNWAEDPTNSDERYRRAWWRARIADMPSAERTAILARIDAAAAARWDEDASVARLLACVKTGPSGAVGVQREAFGAGEDGAHALLSRILRAAGGASPAASSREIDRMLSSIREGGEVKATLGGCSIESTENAVRVRREFGRGGPPDVPTDGARLVCFDERFDIDVHDAPPGARIVALKTLGRGGREDAVLPVLLDAEGTPMAAHPLALRRLRAGLPALVCRERVSWRLGHDLEDVIQIAAKAPEPVGKELAADYLPV